MLFEKIVLKKQSLALKNIFNVILEINEIKNPWQNLNILKVSKY